MSWVYLDGAIVPEAEARVAASDQGLLFGRGVFETFRATRGYRVFRLDRHIARMQAGAEALGISAPPALAEVEDSVLVRSDASDDARVRQRDGGRGRREPSVWSGEPATDCRLDV
jgi:branched-chain amino acid aminotransferase